MKRNAILLIVVAAIVLIAVGLAVRKPAQEQAATGKAGADLPVLKVGTDAAFPPFEFQDEKTGEIKGFDVDLITAIAQEMGMKAEIINTAWDGIIPGLLNGNYDVIASGMTITDERAQSVDFSDPYFTAGLVIATLANNDSIKTPQDLAGKKVSVQINTTGDLFASKMKELGEVKRFNLVPDAFLELKNGGVDACIMDLAVAKDFVKQDNSFKIVGNPITVEYYGFAIRKGREDLLKNINRALATLKSTGKYDEIYAKYFEAAAEESK
ncbi:MAG: basic amino acid ABC transporter substrate-binding protein [Firmicutes bacterium]|nr:basic amino acid ABC transporter substrate-binding protein [Bacillota bacterium]